MTATTPCVCHTLPITSSYPRFGDRKCFFWAGVGNLPGVLCIEQGKRSNTYEIEEDLATRHDYGTREWLLAKVSGPVAEVYAVRLAMGQWSCTCKGHVCRHGELECCHIHAAQSLLDGGQLDPVPAAWSAPYSDAELAQMAAGSGLQFEDRPGEPTEFELAQTRAG